MTFPQDGGDAIDAPIAIDSSTIDSGPDAAPPDVGLDACIPTPEICDHQDNDCDGNADEGFNLLLDPQNCGDCGVRCSLPNMEGTCNGGTCEYQCLPGFHDLDLDVITNGCEYACIVTNLGVEACDDLDNDCDGATDETFDLTSDANNCGDCGRVCQAIHATPICAMSACTFTDCDAGYADLIPAVIGCEYTCPVFPTEAEACNNTDDDCDGAIDEGNPGGGVACGGGAGVCTPGTTTCVFGTLLCQGEGTPSAEICDDLDNDCDGSVDEDFDKNNDPRYCGGCTACDLAFAIEGCSMGSCTIVACQSGHVDLDGDPANGCEYACTPLGPEVCDGLDNDCDGAIDVDDPSVIVPTNFCVQGGACAGTAPTCAASPCSSTITWRCVYGPDVETDACGSLAPQEIRCDGIDGDCDNAVDDAYALLGTACADSGLGVCRGTGSYVCNATQDDVVCNITSPGAAPSSEVCNNLDDDCDGVLDDGAPDDMRHVVRGGMDFWIYAYEASRPDADALDDGVAAHRACSRPGVIPWRSVTWTEADASCAAAGKRLCTEAEWELSCEGALGLKYPYGNTYDPDACNGNDYDPDCTPPDDDLALPTGTAYGCPAPATTACIGGDGTVDMSGNLKEWTATQVTASPPAYRIRGGSYDNIAAGLTCQFDFLAASQDYYFNNLGFRCCSDTGP